MAFEKIISRANPYTSDSERIRTHKEYFLGSRPGTAGASLPIEEKNNPLSLPLSHAGERGDVGAKKQFE